MFDHVTIRVSDLAAARALYDRHFALLGFEGRPGEGAGFVEWGDFSIAAADAEHPPTRRLHAGFTAVSREAVDAWHAAMTAAGAPSDGEPGPRPEYGPEYYGAFVLDYDGNSIEAVHNPPLRSAPAALDHLWIRVSDAAAARAFWEAAGVSGRPVADRVHFSREGAATFSVVEGEPTEGLHVALPAASREEVARWHERLVGAGYRDHGAPGERPEYHAGYYGAYVLDPDGSNVEAVFHDR